MSVYLYARVRVAWLSLPLPFSLSFSLPPRSHLESSNAQATVYHTFCFFPTINSLSWRRRFNTNAQKKYRARSRTSSFRSTRFDKRAVRATRNAGFQTRVRTMQVSRSRFQRHSTLLISLHSHFVVNLTRIESDVHNL